MKLKFFTALVFVLPFTSAITLRCSDRDINVKDDYFGLWTVDDTVAYTMDEIAINDGCGTCKYFGKGLTTTWKRLGGLDLSCLRGQKLSMLQIVTFHRFIHVLKRRRYIVEEQKKLRDELEGLEQSAEMCLQQLQKD